MLLLLALPAAAAPQRVVSINLCADQLLLALAEPEQIASLSVFAADADLAFLAEGAASFPHAASSAESVIGFKPDLVLAGRFTKTATREALRRLGYPVVELGFVRTVDDGIAQIRSVADLLGQRERGEALVAEIVRARDETAARAADGPRPRIAVYQRRGYVTGEVTLTGDIMRLVGFDNEGGRLAGRTGAFVPLERLVAAPPDFLLLASASPRAEDIGSALLSHPVLAALFPSERRVVVPERLTVCGGPSLPAAIRYLAAEAARARGRP